MKEIEREINLYDLFWFILQKWRLIIVGGIIGILLIGGLGTLIQIRTTTEETKIDLESSFEQLSLNEQSRVTQFLVIDDIYRQIVKENQADPLLFINSNELYRTDVEYLITENEDNVLIASYLKNSVEKFWSSKNGLERFNYVSISYDQNIVISTEQEDLKDEDKPVLMFITIYGKDEDECKASLKDVKEIVKQAQKNIEKLFGKYYLNSTETYIYQTECNDLRNYIDEKKNKEYSWINNRLGSIASFSEPVKQYINEYLFQTEQEKLISEEEITPNKVESYEFGTIINLKYIILGLLVGCCFPAGIWFIIYIFNGNLRYEDDIERIYSLNLMGKVQSDRKLNSIDYFLLKMRRKNIHEFKYQEVIDIIVSEIKIKAMQQGISRIYATGCVVGDEFKKIFNDISLCLSKYGIELVEGKSILYFAEALEQSAEIGNVLLIEKSEKTKYHELEQEIHKTETRGIQILGIVIVE